MRFQVRQRRPGIYIHSPRELREWLRPCISGPCRLVSVPASRFSGLKKSLRAIGPLRSAWGQMRSRMLPVPVSSGYVESQRFDLVHFPTQAAYALFAIHLPALGSATSPLPAVLFENGVALRERWYRAYCAQAAFVCVQTEWSRRDVIEKYGFHPTTWLLSDGDQSLTLMRLPLHKPSRTRWRNIVFRGSSSSIPQSPGPIRTTRTSAGLFTFSEGAG